MEKIEMTQENLKRLIEGDLGIDVKNVNEALKLLPELGSEIWPGLKVTGYEFVKLPNRVMRVKANTESVEYYRETRGSAAKDTTNPGHYKQHPSGVECIRITEHLDFCTGNAIKYLWRAGLKGDAVADLEKAKWYIERRIALLKKESQ